jgi:hypothetical protein
MESAGQARNQKSVELVVAVEGVLADFHAVRGDLSRVGLGEDPAVEDEEELVALGW